jgi:ferredoxin
MNKQALAKLVENIFGAYLIVAPKDFAGVSRIVEIRDPAEIDWSGAIPVNSFKPWLTPMREELLVYEKNKVKPVEAKMPKVALLAMNILDLEAFGLFELVFAEDSYYLRRRENMLIVGFSAGIEADYGKHRIFHHEYEENILEHRVFDIFIEEQKNGAVKFFSGSERGRGALEAAGIEDFKNIIFAGFVPETGPRPLLLELKKRVKDGFDNKVWDELAGRCLACGRCAIACPTCFCSDNLDQPEANQVKKTRQWSSCFFNDFSTVAGGHEYLESVKEKLYFYYTHKFVRIPEQFSVAGCVSCRRCVNVCPVGIDIFKVLEALK